MDKIGIIDEENIFENTNTLQNNSESELDLFDDDIFKEIKDVKIPFEKRIEGHTVNCYNYLKHDGGKIKPGSKPTGQALIINEVPDLAVVDVDVKTDPNIVREEVMEKLSDEDVVVQTCSGGLHIYCNKGGFKTASNRMVKAFSCDDYDVDIFCTIDSKKRSLIVLPESKVRPTHKSTGDNNSKVGVYTFIRGSKNSIITRNIQDILKALDIVIPEKEINEAKQAVGPVIPMKDIKKENKEESDTIISNELTDAIVNGLFDLEIHNDGGSRPIDKEITLFTLFPALNSLNRSYIDEAYNNVFTKCNLTLNAQMNFLRMKERYSTRETSPFILIKMLHIWKPEYYEEVIKPIIESEEPTINPIVLTDEFSMLDIKKKCEDGLYTCEKEVVQDVSRVVRYVIGTDNIFLIKYYDAKSSKYNIGFSSENTMMTYLRKCRAWRVGKRVVTLADVFNRNESRLTVKGVCFNTDDPNVFSLFQGYKYNFLPKVDETLIKPFLDFILEVICDSNNEAYIYVLKWISYIVQNPGVKTKTAIVLKGLQGIGKGTFTDTLCDMLAGYSAKNVTDISELTGTFNSVVENKMLIVLNELKNCGDDRGANFNSLKSIITENEIRINEKNQPRRDGDNVANFIFVTNNAYPVKIETGDRRYLVLKVSGLYKGDLGYFNKLYKLRQNPDFYPNLLTYFNNYDLHDFLPARIPMTSAKQDIIRASLSVIELFIVKYFKELKEGMPCAMARNLRPMDLKENSFNLMINEKCEHTRKSIDKKQVYIYKLKNECIPLYEKLAEEIGLDLEEEGNKKFILDL